MEKAKTFLKKYGIFCLITAQPVLDALAYFTQNAVVTPSGVIRLVIMFALPLYLLITMEDKRRIIVPMAVIGIFCAAHVLNCMRVGYISMVSDVKYMISVAQMPVLTICFILLIRDEETKKQAVYGVLAAAVLYTVFLLLSVITGSNTPTYLKSGLGLSGWVIPSNRSAVSVILTIFCAFGLYYAVSTDKKLFQWTIPPAATLLLIANGTSACYLALFGILAAFSFYLLLEPKIKGTKLRWRTVAFFCALMAASAALYPLTPEVRNDKYEEMFANKYRMRADFEMGRTGIDVSGMSIDEMLSNEAVREKIYKIYRMSLNYSAPQLLKDFGYERVMEKYDYSLDTDYLGDVRRMKRVYAELTFEDCDTPTRFLGFDSTRMSRDSDILDLENDWHALFYYYGYVGFTLYIAFILYFIFLIIRALIKDFRGSYTPLNFTLMLSLVLLLGLAQFSGAVLRRPNVSIYMSLVLALIYYQTVTAFNNRKGAEE